jgi:hypothetical protein
MSLNLVMSTNRMIQNRPTPPSKINLHLVTDHED